MTGGQPTPDGRPRPAWLTPAIEGGLWMIGGGASVTAMITIVRHFAGEYSPFELLFFRNIIGLALMMPWVVKMARGGARNLVSRIPLLQLTRTAFSYVAMLSWFFAVMLIPLSDAVALHFTLPLFTALGAALILKEQIDAPRLAAMGIAFLGVLIILRPGMQAFSPAALLVLLSAAAYGATNITLRALADHDSPNLTVLYGVVLMAPLSLVPALFEWRTPAIADIPLIVALGAVGVAAQLCLTRSFKAAEASVVIPYDFLRLPMSAAAAYLLFAESLDAFTWVGALVIFAATTYIMRREARLRRKRST